MFCSSIFTFGSKRERNRLSKAASSRVRGKSASSTQWLRRQLSDPVVAEAKARGYRSRASLKLLEISERFNLFDNCHSQKPYQVVDLGCAPGGWMQVALEKMPKENAHLTGIDLLKLDPFDDERAHIIQQDIDTVDIDRILEGRGIDVLLCDMAPSYSGDRAFDHSRLMDLANSAFFIAQDCLNTHGAFVVKLSQGAEYQEFIKQPLLQQSFEKVKNFKPKSSRKQSTEIYLIAQGFLKFNN
mmetsp:Transcript_2083/g.2951  ORF Transcript_2083/g.2951 Transcript_2083/m.2951 type:complete len:242 (-) Transcript_2083:66-791(-)